MSRRPASSPIKPGCIFVLQGCTSTGKTTICNKVLEQNSQLPATQQLDWLIDGTDLAASRGERNATVSAINNAIANSKLGKPTILDFGAIGFSEKLLQERLKEKGVTAPYFIAVVNLPIDEIARRVTARNDLRPNAAAYIKGLAILLSTKQEPGARVAGEINEEQIRRAVQTINNTEEETLEEQINFFKDAFGIKSSADRVTLYTNKKCDAVFQPTTLEEADKIAGTILGIATQQKRNTTALVTQNNSNSVEL